jgi:sporulation protein YlmC with PRC-barrel domain
MKPELKYAAYAAALILVSTTANAQSSARTERAQEFSQSVSYHDYLKGKNLRASELVGERVRNAEGDALGEIEEIVIPTDGRGRVLVILSVGGVADVHDKLVALPYDDLRVSPDGDNLYVDRSDEQLKAAPEFSYDAQAERQASAQRASTPAARATKAENLVLDVFDYRASDLIGATVLDDRGEHVAKVDDVVVSTEDGKLHAVLAIGGFLGFGAKLISMPFDELQITSAGDNPQLRIKMTGDQLQQLADSRPPFNYERQVAKAPGNAPRG